MAGHTVINRKGANTTMIILLLILTLAAAPGASAQKPLTLDQAVDLALRQNTSLRAASLDHESSTWNTRQAYTNFLPRVELSAGVTRIDAETDARANAAVDFIREAAVPLGIPQSLLANIRPFAYRQTYATDVTVVQPIYNGGMELAGLKAANAREDQSAYSLQEAQQALIAGVRTSYFAVLRNEALLALAKESSERTRRWLDMMVRREELGERTPTDVLRFRVQLAQEEGNIVSAGNLLASSRLHLNELMGEPLDADYVLEEVASMNPDSATATLPSAPGADTVLADHPAILAAEASVRLAETGINLAWTRFQPRVNLAFQYGWEHNNTAALDGYHPWALALTLNWPIFNSFGDYANLQKSEAEAGRAAEEMETFRRQLRIQATDAALNLEAALQRVDIASVGLREAVKVLESVSRRYELGSASNVDLIDAHTAHTQAKTGYITAVYDSYIAAVQLDRARGSVTR
jgi:outer membrane protein